MGIPFQKSQDPRHLLEQEAINLKSWNVDKLKSEYQELIHQKNELTDTYKFVKKEFLS